MDPKSTGEFITTLRKKQELTQKQLAEKLNVSDKAVSRWETGKGYPDIESLMALSDLFSVSVNEILCGKHINTPSLAQIAEKDIASAYIQTTEKKQKISKLSIILAILLSLIIVTVIFIAFSNRFQLFYRDIMGSPNCVIAEDYSYMTLFEERYVPLVLNGVDCTPSEVLIPEAQLEGETFFGKLLFGDMIYSVRGCENNDIVYLQTDSGPFESLYYCKESKVNAYKVLSQQPNYDLFTAQIETRNWTIWDLTLSNTVSQMLKDKEYTLSDTVNCGIEYESKRIIIHAKMCGTPFIRKDGELICKNGQYYWFDYDDIPSTQNNADYNEIMAYEINDRYDAELDRLFSFVHQ